MKRVRLQRETVGLDRYKLEILTDTGRRIVLPPTRQMQQLALDGSAVRGIFHLTGTFRVVCHHYRWHAVAGWHCIEEWMYVDEPGPAQNNWYQGQF
ncbi:hypothetical protein [Thermogemmatispora sp.]|jgi:hypothetical protein|uniref:hypothetical protein n=1 Tax=Thermogemmatispora sp. TaxID=1968838 RepID=UPI0035E3F53B